MYLSTILSPLVIVLLAASLLCVLMMVAIFFFRVRNVVKYRRKSDRERVEKPDSEYLPASVIIYSQGESENLTEFLETVLAQDYPAPYEVIVVNDGESADVRDVVSMLRASHSNLYLTFTPEGVVNLSRKKLGITLGIKAARYEVVVQTTTAADIRSPYWLRRMMSRFDRDGRIEVVLGYTAVDPAEDQSFGKRRRAFDFVADSVRWLAPAIAGNPFRGSEFNIAYRKDTFMRNKGFARHLNLNYGDDDIFVSEIARRGNTGVEISEDSIVRLRHGNHPRIFSERVLRHFFTESFIRHRPRLLSALGGWLQTAALATAVAAAVIAWPNAMAAIAAAAILVIMMIVNILVWRSAMKALGSRNLVLTLPWLSFTRPYRKILWRVRSKFGHHKKYTWD